jgi:tetraprenyl-beta-curcumene synthase
MTHTAHHVPSKPIPFMKEIYQCALPLIHRTLDGWREKAENIPNEELRKQALASIRTKRFHCEGGGLYALLGEPDKKETVVQFIVAYQTISDYLDNLCDRSVSMDGANFRTLHQAMEDAINGEVTADNYYAGQEDQDDGGYLLDLVHTCHRALQQLPSYAAYRSRALTLCRLYCDLQVYKHISWDHREQALEEWWNKHKGDYPQLFWYEFGAATGSTLGIFYYAALASRYEADEVLAEQAFDVYFPYIQGLHILLDYLIDQEEDRQGGDLNFCFYYASDEEKMQRFEWFTRMAKERAGQLPDHRFHEMIVEGLLGMYLSQEKVRQQPDVLAISRRLLKRSKLSTWFFYVNTWYIHRKGKAKEKKRS